MVTPHMPEDWSGAVDWKGKVDWTSQVTWAGTRLPLTEATGLHPAMYSDESFFAAEQKRLFERAWVAVGTAAEVAEAGRLLVRQVGGRSIIITRDQEGVLHGFVNSCRHRGTELAETDCDIGNTIRCPITVGGMDSTDRCGRLRSSRRSHGKVSTGTTSGSLKYELILGACCCSRVSIQERGPCVNGSAISRTVWAAMVSTNGECSQRRPLRFGPTGN